MNNKNQLKLSGPFASIIRDFVNEKQNIGYKYTSQSKTLSYFDKYTLHFDVNNFILSKEIVERWSLKQPNESYQNQKLRIWVIKQLALYMRRQGYQAYLPSSHILRSSRATYSPYIFNVEELSRIFQKADIEIINIEVIKSFLSWLEDERKCSISTRNQRLAAIHSFMRYLQAESPEKKNRPIINYLSADDIKLILEQPDLSRPEGRRDLVLLCVMYDTGARVQEVADLVVRNVRLECPAKIHLTGKGRKSREVPLLSKTTALLQKYMIEQKLKTPDKLDYPLFFNRQKEKLTRAGISYILNKYVQIAKTKSSLLPETVTPHVLRHTKAMHLLQAGVNLVYIRDILGHVDISTTEVYARADTEMKRMALEKANNIEQPSVPSWVSDTDLLSWLKDYSKIKP